MDNIISMPTKETKKTTKELMDKVWDCSSDELVPIVEKDITVGDFIDIVRNAMDELTDLLTKEFGSNCLEMDFNDFLNFIVNMVE